MVTIYILANTCTYVCVTVNESVMFQIKASLLESFNVLSCVVYFMVCKFLVFLFFLPLYSCGIAIDHMHRFYGCIMSVCTSRLHVYMLVRVLAPMCTYRVDLYYYFCTLAPIVPNSFL